MFLVSRTDIGSVQKLSIRLRPRQVPAHCTLDPWSVEYNYRRGSHTLDTTPVPQPVAQFVVACGTDAHLQA